MARSRTAVHSAAVPAQGIAALGELVALAKPRLSGMVVSTAAAGLWLAPVRLSAMRAAAFLLGTATVVGAANVMNNYLERDVDGRMRRTRDRPLPSGRVEPAAALALGFVLPTFAVPVLALSANPLTALLASVAFVTYAFVYTPLKRVSTVALFVGAVPGAIPPLMGWTAATGGVGARGLALFALLFVWQIPHFLAISIYLKEDYARGGLKVFALVHGERAARRFAVASSALLVPVGMLPSFLGMAGPLYGAAAAALGTGLTAVAVAGLRLPEGSARWARGFFLSTLLYLVLLFIALFLGAR
ncbi:MAG TPA: heme o synthase [Anaeromyxobacteraceae bacterium]|nr:heme o synthase [Anaeromyxobacteraceae bacterium]